MKPFKKTILIASGLFVFEAFVLDQGIVALLIILLTLFIFLPRSLWALRSSRRLYPERLSRAGFICWQRWQCLWPMLCRTAWPTTELERSKACLAYHAKYNHHRQHLEELVPEFIPSVPVAKYTLGGGGSFFYSSRPGDGEPMLYYQALPTFGGRFYHLETGG